jgi:predicted SAM-dependent methyltransferase
MHESAMNNAKVFFGAFTNNKDAGIVVDIGSQNVNGTLKTIVPKKFNYIGVDYQRGPNVDLVLENPYKLPFENQSIDIVISSSCLEHSEFFWITFVEMVRITKPDGLIYINVPSEGDYHAHPVDCWRFRQDAAYALSNYVNQFHGFNTSVLLAYLDIQGPWHDMVAIYCKEKEFDIKYHTRETK